jgi:hypothetical protein
MTKTLLAGLSLVGLTLALSAPAFAEEFGGFHGKVKVIAKGVGHADGIDGNADGNGGTGTDAITGAVANNTLVQVTTNTLKVIKGKYADLAAKMDFGDYTFQNQKVVVNNFTTAANSGLQGAIALAGQNNAN